MPYKKQESSNHQVFLRSLQPEHKALWEMQESIILQEPVWVAKGVLERDGHHYYYILFQEYKVWYELIDPNVIKFLGPSA